MKKVLTAVLLTVSATLVAAELSEEKLQVRSMIQEIKQTPEGERYQKMNQFKKQIRLMRSETQAEALSELNAALGVLEQAQTRTQTRTNEGNAQGTQEQIRTQDRLQLHEAQQQLQLQNQTQNQNRIQKMGAGSTGTGNGSGRK